MVANAAAAAGRIVSSVAHGKIPVVTQETFNQRMTACKACDQSELVRNTYRCNQCGCFLDGKFLAKARLETECCPLGKWGEA